MKTSLILIVTLPALCLASCTSYDTGNTTNAGRGSTAGPTSGWSTGTGGFGNVSRDSGSGLRGGGVGAGTSGSTAVGWIEGAPGAKKQ
jgi:hypothetical protein